MAIKQFPKFEMYILLAIIFMSVNSGFSNNLAFAFECMNTLQEENEKMQKLYSELEDITQNMNLIPENEDKFKTSMLNNELKESIDQSNKCLTLLGSSDNNNGVNDGLAYTIIATVFAAIGGSIIGVWFSHRKNQNKIQSNNKTSILLSLKNLEDTLDQKQTFTNPLTQQKIQYVNQQLSTTPFDSIVSSGSFMYFSPELQEKIDSLYFQVVQHNKKLSVLDQLEIKAATEIIPSSMKPNMMEVIMRLMIELSVTENYVKKKHIVDIKRLL